jgi:hypothetical protein
MSVDSHKIVLWSFSLSVSLLFFSQLQAQNFLRGDANCDGCVSFADAYDLSQAIFFPGLITLCNCNLSSDTNDDDALDVQDVIYILQFRALGGPPPPAPYPICGPDPTGGGLTCPGYPACPLFKRGDADCDGCVSSADAAFLTAFLMTGGPPPCCNEAADADNNGVLSASDSVFILAYCNTGGPVPSAPGPLVCGPDPAPGALGCASYPESACCSGCRNQLPGDCNQDGALDIGDPVCLLGFCFLGVPAALPCGDGALAHTSNITLMDCNGDGSLDCLADAICLLQFLFLGGPPPAGGTSCVYIEKCPQGPACPICTP